MDQTAARAAALLAAAINHMGHGWSPANLTAEAAALVPWITPAAPARMTLTIKGDPMPLTIDSRNAVAVLEFTDRAGDPVPPPPGTTATATSSDPGVLTAGAARPGTAAASGAPTIEFPLTEVAAGTATLTVHATAADGTPLLGPDATTPITDAPPVEVTVNPGAAAAERFTVPADAPDAAPAPDQPHIAAAGQPGESPGQPAAPQQAAPPAQDPAAAPPEQPQAAAEAAGMNPPAPGPGA